MTQRTCSSCGAFVALLDDRCRACGADPELRLLELRTPVERPQSGRGPPRSGSWRRRGAVAAGIAALWAFLAYAGGSADKGIPVEDAEGTTTTTTEAEDREARPTTSLGAPTTTTTQVVPGAPLLGEPTGLALVVVSSSSRVIDLDTGGVTRVGLPVLGVTAGGLLVNDGAGIVIWPPPYDGSGSTTILPLGRANLVDQLWVVDDGRLVWALERPADATSFGLGWSLSLVDLDGAPLGGFELPAEAGPAGATDHGVVVTAPGGAYLVGADGDVERISTGDAFGVTGDRIHVLDCDEQLRCRVEVFDGRGRFVDHQPAPVDPVGPVGLVGLVGWATAAPDGRLAQIVFSGEFGEPREVTVDGVTVYEQDGSPPGAGGPDGLAWSPDGRWLAIVAQDAVHVLDTLGAGGEREIDPGFVEHASTVFLFEPPG